MVRFVHTADWQLGMVRHFFSPDAESRYAEARLDAVRAVGKLAREHACGFIAVAGDVFETNHVGSSVVLPALEAMGACELPVLLLPGNHDPFHPGSVYATRTFLENRPENVTVLEPGSTVVVDGVEVVAAAWETTHPDENPVERALAGRLGGTGPRVLVAHGIVDALSPQSTQASVIRLASLERAIDEGVVDYVALGDRHSTTPVGGSGRIWYSGTPLVTSYRESQPNRALVVDMSGVGVDVEAHEVGEWRFVERRFDLVAPDDVAAVDEWLARLEDRRRTVVSLSFVGTVSLASRARLDDVLARHRDVLAALEVHERYTDLAVLPDEADLERVELTGFAATALAELVGRAQAGSGEGTAIARDALALLYRLAKADR